MTDTIIADIKKNIDWLDKNVKSTNVLTMSITVDKLQIQAVTLSDLVTDVYELMNNAEDDYKIAVAKFVDEYDGSTAAAERKAEAKFADLKKIWTGAKNAYKRLDTLLDRIDKICDSKRQRISVVKQADLKNV